MAKKMNEWFQEHDFNDAPLPSGHKERFLEKLDAKSQKASRTQKSSDKLIAFMSWKQWAVAASILVLLGIGTAGLYKTSIHTIEQLSPEMASSQELFTKTIDATLAKLEQEQSPETERIIADTKKNLTKLENDYQQIAKDFALNNNTAVMESMLDNFKTRVSLLEQALEHINNLKRMQRGHETTTL